MASSTNTFRKPRVLILDVGYNSALADTSFVVQAIKLFGRRLNCHIEQYVTKSSPVAGDSAIYTSSWDLIIIPQILSSATYYTNALSAIAAFTDTTIPIAIYPLMHTVTGSSLTGVSALSATTGDNICTGLTNWQSRQSGRVSFYGRPAATFSGTDHTLYAVNGTGEGLMWSRVISGHPTLFTCTYSTWANSSNQAFKPWLAFQWMIDQQSTTAKKYALREKMRKAVTVLRWDGFNIAAMRTALTGGELDTTYNALVSYGVKEVQVAVSSDAAANGNAALLAWFQARRRSQGGILAFHNHETDMVDGTNASREGTACTSNGLAYDQFPTSHTNYRTRCDEYTALGFDIGSDGYGAGAPNVQNSNYMNNPSARFIGNSPYNGYGGINSHPWLLLNTTYPVGGASAETPKAKKHVSHWWNGGRTLLSFNGDALDTSTAGEISLQFNQNILYMFAWGGGMYLHGDGIQKFSLYAAEYGQLFTSCPDVLDSGPFSSLLEQMKCSCGHWYG